MQCFEAGDALFAVSSLANLGAGYNLAVTGHVLFLLEHAGVDVSEEAASSIASAAFVGAMVGQLVMGYAGERLGIVPGLAVAFIVLCIGCVAGALLTWGDGVLAKLAASRFLVGFGAGGVYPLAAIASAEKTAGGKFDGQRVMLAFSFQGVGQLTAPAWVLLLDLLLADAGSLAWRVAILSGAIPPAFALGKVVDVYRESAASAASAASRRRGLSAGSEPALAAQGPPAGPVARWTRGNLLRLVGTGGSWFLFDVMFYGNIVFTPYVLELVFKASSNAQIAALSTLIGLVALPGLYLASFMSESWGSKRIQLAGFCSAGALFLLLFIMLHFGSQTSPVLLFLLYCLTFFFYNFGPNATTFCLPAETFPHEVRSFFNGLSAACGKLGAAVGASLFKVLLDATGLAMVMLVSAFLSALAILVTLFFVGRRSSAPELEPEVELQGMDRGLGGGGGGAARSMLGSPRTPSTPGGASVEAAADEVTHI